MIGCLFLLVKITVILLFVSDMVVGFVGRNYKLGCRHSDTTINSFIQITCQREAMATAKKSISSTLLHVMYPHYPSALRLHLQGTKHYALFDTHCQELMKYTSTTLLGKRKS